jgi:hypothetical protein
VNLGTSAPPRIVLASFARLSKDRRLQRLRDIRDPVQLIQFSPLSYFCRRVRSATRKVCSWSPSPSHQRVDRSDMISRSSCKALALTCPDAKGPRPFPSLSDTRASSSLTSEFFLWDRRLGDELGTISWAPDWKILDRAVRSISATDVGSLAAVLRIFEHLRREPADFARQEQDRRLHHEISARLAVLREPIGGDAAPGSSSFPIVSEPSSVLSS